MLELAHIKFRHHSYAHRLDDAVQSWSATMHELRIRQLAASSITDFAAVFDLERLL